MKPNAFDFVRTTIGICCDSMMEGFVNEKLGPIKTQIRVDLKRMYSPIKPEWIEKSFVEVVEF